LLATEAAADLATADNVNVNDNSRKPATPPPAAQAG